MFTQARCDVGWICYSWLMDEVVAPICKPCRDAQDRWRDSQPSKVLPTFGFTYGSGTPYDTTPAAIKSRNSERYERWRRLVKESVKQIAAGCRAGHHAPEQEDDEE